MGFGSKVRALRIPSTARPRGVIHPKVVFHIAGGRAELKRGWYFNGGDPSHFAILQLVNGSIVPQIALAAMLIEGIFERHPGLVVIVEELGITWLPHFLSTIDSLAGGPYGELFGYFLREHKLRCRVVSERGLNALRVSTHIFNAVAECDRVVEATIAALK